jgi:hypothetical protein
MQRIVDRIRRAGIRPFSRRYIHFPGLKPLCNKGEMGKGKEGKLSKVFGISSHFPLFSPFTLRLRVLPS